MPPTPARVEPTDGHSWSARLQGIVVALAAIGLIWLVASGISRGQGVYPFGAGLGLLALAGIAFRRGYRQPLYALLYALVLAGTFVVGFEGLLRLRPEILRGRFANVAYTGYHWQRGGIYRLDPHRGPALRPSVRRWMYWNGHWWRHETNADGYRGPLTPHPAVAFLGDSMVYGHGVSEGDTVSARFTALTGRPAANLGQQGIGLLQALLILREYGPRLRPPVVVVFSHPTDPSDSIRYYPIPELERFTASSLLAGAPPPRVRDEYQPPAWWNPRYVFATHLAAPFYCSGLLGTFARRSQGLDAAADRPAGRDPFVPTDAEIAERVAFLTDEATPEERLGWQVHRHAILEMKRLAATWGGRLVLSDLGYPEAYSRAIENLARELELPYTAAGRVALARSRSGEEVYLADDGHWTGTGAAIVARELAPLVLESVPTRLE